MLKQSDLRQAEKPDDPFLSARLEILNEAGTAVDNVLMASIAAFSDRYSWRSHLAVHGKPQYIFTMHTTFGRMSEVNDPSEVVAKWQPLYTGKKYLKIHASGQKVYFE